MKGDTRTLGEPEENNYCEDSEALAVVPDERINQGAGAESHVLGLINELSGIQRDIKGLLHDSRHLQHETLKVNYDLRSKIENLQEKLDETRTAHSPIIATAEKLKINSSPRIAEFLKVFDSRSHDVTAEYYLDHSIRRLSPQTVVQGFERKVALISSWCRGERGAALTPCFVSQSNFAERHGYAHIVLEQHYSADSKNNLLDKIALAYSMLDQGYDNVFFVADTAMITNLEAGVGPLIHAISAGEFCFGLTEDGNGVDLDVFLIRNCPQSRALLNLIWLLLVDSCVFRSGSDVLSYLMSNFISIQRWVYIEHNSKALHSWPLERNLFQDVSPKKSWSNGDLICNFSGFEAPHLEAFVSRYASSFNFRAEATVGSSPAPRRTGQAALANDGATGTISCSSLGQWGQFGNQLFQIAAVLGYASKNNAKVLLPKWYCKLSDQDHGSRFKGIEAYYGEQVQTEIYYEPSFAFNEIPYREHMDIHGSFQSEKYFEHVASDIRALFSEPPEIKSYLDKFCAEYGCDNFDAIHVRNYLNPVTDIGFGDMERLPEAYFLAALRRIDGGIPLFVATDKRDYVDSLFHAIGQKRRIVTMDVADPLLDFFMLSRARKMVMSNSSFSWWAAYLGREKESIIAPHRYFWFSRSGRRNPHYDTRDLYPSNYQELIM